MKLHLLPLNIVLAGMVVLSPLAVVADSARLPGAVQVNESANGSAQPLFDKGSQLIKQQRLTEGVEWLEKAAAQGHADAAYELGSLAELGLGTAKDYIRARAYYEQAARLGHRDAQFNLALLLVSTEAPFQDLVKARTVMTTIASQGDREAQYTLALMMKESLGKVEAEPMQAILWTQAAADQGHPIAQFSLGMHYLKGEFLERDPGLARKWFQRAADQKVAVAQFNLALMYEQGDGVATDIPAALKWYESAAALGNANAQQNLGIKYLLGDQVASNPTKAISLIKRAGNAGLPNSQYLLGKLYESGYETTIPVDLGQSEQWYTKAATQGHTEAQFQLALLLAQKKERRPDARFWIEQAATSGHRAAIAMRDEM